MSSETKREYYLKNKEKLIEDQKLKYKKLREIFVQWRNTLKCSRCSESDPNCLDFHHYDPLKKEVNLIQMVTRGYGSVIKELSKCIVVCTNCHRKIHAYNIEVKSDDKLGRSFESFHKSKI